LHAQFESIHPFLDGNGRIGRIIIPLYMMQVGQLPSPIFFVSEELEKQRAKYNNLLNKTRGAKPILYSWIEFFIISSDKTVKKLNILLDNANKLAEEGISQCSSSTERYIYLLTFSIPNITAVEAAQQVKVAPTTARRALNTLVEKDLLFKDPSQRNVEYFNYNILDLFDR